MALDPDDLPDDVERELLKLLDGPTPALGTAIERFCAAYPGYTAAIRRVVAAASSDAATVKHDRKHSGEGSERVRSQPSQPREIGPFHILSEIGSGGMGTVYLAEQRQPVSRRVALKVIKPGMDTERVLGRFDIERQALAMMDHACIAKVYEAGATAEGRPYFAMEYVKGVPITRYCDDQKLSIEERLRLLQQVCSGVQHAHHKGVIHRDLTPNNILVAVQDAKPTAKIIDFGLARATDHRLTDRTVFTEPGVVMGTPEYMSPEQAGLDGLDVDSRTDVYTLGVLMYELLTGKLPFSSAQLRAGGAAKMCEIIRRVEPEKPSTRITKLKGDTEAAAKLRRTEPAQFLRRLRGDLDWMVLKCLEKDRTRRYQTVNALAEDIDRHLGDRPIEARPPSAMYLLRKFAKRYRGPVVAALLVLSAFIVGFVVCLYFWGLATKSAERERELKVVAEEERRLADQARVAAEADKRVANQARARAVDLQKVADDQAQLADARARALEAMQKEMLDLVAKVARGEEKAASLDQLVGALKFKNLIEGQEALWPVAAHADELADWATRAEAALATNDDLERMVSEVEARATQAIDAEQQRERDAKLAHARTKVEALRRAQAARSGGPAVPIPELSPADGERVAGSLNAAAWDGVAPWPQERKTYGDEARSLALAEAALAKVDASDPTTARDDVLETLMWAFYSVGQDAKARAAGDQSVEAARPAQAADRRRSRLELERQIAGAPHALEVAVTELRQLETTANTFGKLRFTDEVDAVLHATLRAQLDEQVGFQGGPVASVRRRLAWLRQERKQLEDHALVWHQTSNAIRVADGLAASKLYDQRLSLKPILGLVPLGANPMTKLLEFYHPRSAANPAVLPTRRGDGGFDVDQDTGLIFVLLPGGTFMMGAQGAEQDGEHFDKLAERDESPVHAVSLDAFLLSRYEMTQAQWRRLTGEQPSHYAEGTAPAKVRTITGSNPVERVSWDDCQKWLPRHELVLPTEAQWEYACRAGTDTPWWSGDEGASLELVANISDQTARHQAWASENWDDGHIVHAPVGSFAPNLFGLHDMHGNVWEWTLDGILTYTATPRLGDGLRDTGYPGARGYRGGCYSDPASKVRSSKRNATTTEHRQPIVGVRPARMLNQ